MEKIIRNLKKVPKHNNEWTLLINEASEYSYLDENDTFYEDQGSNL